MKSVGVFDAFDYRHEFEVPDVNHGAWFRVPTIRAIFVVFRLSHDEALSWVVSEEKDRYQPGPFFFMVTPSVTPVV